MTTSRDVLGALYKHFAQRYACLTEITVTEPVASNGHFPVDRRCDLLLVSRTERINVEVKVSRADFLADIAAPEKQAAWQHYTHRWAYAVPRGLVLPHEVPPGWGLLYVGEPEQGSAANHWRSRPAVEWHRKAPKHKGRTPADLPERVQYALMHRLARAEAHAKGYGWDVHRDGEDPEVLRATVERLRRDLEIANDRAMRERSRAAEWRKAYGAGNPIPCGTCGQPLTASLRRGYLDNWRHPDSEHEAACLAQRTEQARAEQEERKARNPSDSWLDGGNVYVPPPYPAEEAA